MRRWQAGEPLVEKSRDMGVTWTIFDALHWGAGKILSTRADDEMGLFWKLDYFNKNLPSWMLPLASIGTSTAPT